MKDARQIAPGGPDHERLRGFDLREINAADPGEHMALKYTARLEGVLEAARRYIPRGGLVLEVGCAQANAGLLLAEGGYRCVGVDLLAECLGYARLKRERGEFHAVCGDAEHLPFAEARFDAAVVGELLEHCARPAEVLARIAGCVRPGGVLILSTTNGDRMGNGGRTYAQVRPDEDEQRQYGRGGEDHLAEFTLREFVQVIRDAGLELVRTGRLGSALHTNRLRFLRPGLPPRAVRGLTRPFNALPVIGPRLGLTLLAVARRH